MYYFDYRLLKWVIGHVKEGVAQFNKDGSVFEIFSTVKEAEEWCNKNNVPCPKDLLFFVEYVT